MANRGLANRQQNTPTTTGSDYLSLREAMDRLFQDSFVWPRGFMGGDMISTFGAQPLDMYETQDDLVVKTALPGMKPEDVNVQVQGDQLIIDANRSEEEQQNVTYHYRGMVSGEYHRQITLPMAVDTNRVEATFDNGVLTVCLPKSEEVKPKKIQIKPSGTKSQSTK